jgi:hypothetical protein
MFAIKMQLMYYCMYINIDQQTITKTNQYFHILHIICSNLMLHYFQ